MIYRERLAPVTLTREDSVAQTVVYLHTTDVVLLHEHLGGLDGLLHGQSVERQRLAVILHALLARCRRVAYDALLGVV